MKKNEILHRQNNSTAANLDTNHGPYKWIKSECLGCVERSGTSTDRAMLLGVYPQMKCGPSSQVIHGHMVGASTPCIYTRDTFSHLSSPAFSPKCRADVSSRPSLPFARWRHTMHGGWGDTGWRSYTYRIRQRGLPVLPYRNNALNFKRCCTATFDSTN